MHTARQNGEKVYGGGHLKSTVRAHLDLLTNTVSYTYCNNTVQTSAVAVGALNLIESFIYSTCLNLLFTYLLIL